MIRFYIQQAIYHLRENPVISWISVLGTALSICMIMVIVIIVVIIIIIITVILFIIQ